MHRIQNSQTTSSLPDFSNTARIAAAEGAVLLRNEQNMLPLRPGDSISLFGRCQIDYYRSGTGSGGSVHVPYTTNLLDSLRRHSEIHINEELASLYLEWRKAHPFDNGGGGWACEPWYQKEMPLDDRQVAAARRHSSKAVIVIGRTAGEDKDNSEEAGSLYLTDEEKNMISLVASHFEQTAVLFNVSNIIDMGFLENDTWGSHICSLLYVWQGGMEGGNAAADLLCGTITPSGKLPDTIARTLSDYPSASNYGNSEENYYEEDIYVGYRYFETFAPDRILFPFGFGLSYASFSTEIRSAGYNGERIQIKAAVTNTHANYSGKEVVAVYCEAPQGKLGKPRCSLCSFAKTRLLAPGESELLTLEIPVSSLASYDDSGITGQKSCYVLEEGVYQFHIGHPGSFQRIVFPQGEFRMGSLQVVSRLEEALSPVRPFSRIRPGARQADGSYELCREAVPVRSFSVAERISRNLPEEIPQTPSRGITLQDVKSGRHALTEFIAQFSEQELCCLIRAEGMSNPYVTPGTASAFGGLTDTFYEHGLPVACCSDGPSGIRMESGRTAAQLPIGTLLASTWNPALIEELYELEGREMLLNQVDNLLGPGMNIHRSPRNGRNFEYFSEDPLLTGVCATAVARGIHKAGATCTLKHFACNNQETFRHASDSVVSERALREIYLKAFEIAVKSSPVNSIMTSYNSVNGNWTASNYDLTTTILRREWGFQGIVMTDWWAHVNDVGHGGSPDKTDLCSMVKAQNDLYMVVPNGHSLDYPDNLSEALADGRLTVGELQTCAIHICCYLSDIPAFYRERPERTLSKSFAPLPEACQTALCISPEAAGSLEPTDGNICFAIEKPGIYHVSISYLCSNRDTEQSTCNFYVNDEPYQTLQCGGTGSEEKESSLAFLHLAAGSYRLSYQMADSSILIKKINLTFYSEI